ncbi:MAG TPA: MaoC family dehydratase, partial [Dehalococcoidia bacterium]|nr:MaoC family dehydratase [Dehalococcoidia bacterium]
MSGNIRGNFFEDLAPGRLFRHAIPRTVTAGDIAMYVALTGDRRPLYCSREFAAGLGYPKLPVNDLLMFHLVFGRTVADISLNSPANLGYADVRFGGPVYVGDTLRAETEVIGRRETSRGDIGIVWVHSRGYNQREETVLQFYRWVMVRKREPQTNTGADDSPELPSQVAAENLALPPDLELAGFDSSATGGALYWEDYQPGQRIVHPYGQTVEEAEHQMAARLYQNMARA